MHVHWHEGLFLQPHHLQIMQRRLLTDLRQARTLHNPYCFGILEGRISDDHLADGRVFFERLRAILPSGQEVFFPEDANLPPLDIRAELTRGSGPLEILLAVPLWTKNRANAFRQGESADPRVKLIYIPEEAREIADENSGDNPQAVPIRKINARLVLKGDDLSNMESLPLLRVMRTVGADSGKARQDPDFAAPALLLRSSPVLHGLARDLVAQLNASREQLRLKASGGGLGLEVKWELISKLKTLNRFCSSLPSLVEEGLTSPFQVYVAFRELLGELLALAPEKNIFDCEPYNHLEPLQAFRELDQKIRPEIRMAPGKEPLKVQFAGSPGLLRAELEPRHFEVGTGYFLGVKSKVDRTRLASNLVDPNKFKLMPSSMQQIAVQGIELKEADSPPLDLHRENNLYYFLLVPTSNQRRWEQIVREKAMSLVWNNTQLDLSDTTFTLCMTQP
jgi:type VI secretion system protein ImpJ